jgi:hypothetical protein
VDGAEIMVTATRDAAAGSVKRTGVAPFNVNVVDGILAS